MSLGCIKTTSTMSVNVNTVRCQDYVLLYPFHGGDFECLQRPAMDRQNWRGGGNLIKTEYG